MFSLMLPPLIACFVLTGIHAYLGLHVIQREVIFVDLALAQIAALGAVFAALYGMDLHGQNAYYVSLSFTFIGAAIFALTRTREKRVPQEAIIGVVYAVSASAAVLALSKSASAAEDLQEMLVGNILFVTWPEIIKLVVLYSIIGLFHFFFRRQFLAVSFSAHEDPHPNMKVKFWDFLFYVTFGFVVTSSVRIAGVLLVFSFLIVPSIIGALLMRGIASRLLVGWLVGIIASLAGIYASVRFDFPTGASVVCTFGAMLLLTAFALTFAGLAKRRASP